MVQGSPNHAASVFLHGTVVFSLSEPISVKRISLRLYGTLQMNWYDPMLTLKTGSNKSVRLNKVVYEHEWPNLELNSKAAGAHTPTTSGSHTLPVGNHEFPFEVIIPGSIDESVEGLDGAQVIYKLVAKVERGRFANNIVAKKHLRVIRTLGTDALELSQTMTVANTWPNKVDYSISVPTKAIAIGSRSQVSFSFTPLLKGLTLGKTRIQIIEYKILSNGAGSTTTSEKSVAEATIYPNSSAFEDLDTWQFDHLFNVPSSLAKCTQDCKIGKYITVSHKFRFSVSLKNPDGHVSELRATLPISLYISPHVTISSLHHDNTDTISCQLNGTSGANGEDLLFTTAQQSHSNNASGTTTPVNPNASINAPPSYSDHIYDTLWRHVPAPHLDTPLESGANTPGLRSRRNSNDFHLQPHGGSSGFGATERSHLLSNLYALQERQNREEMQGNINSVLGSDTPSGGHVNGHHTPGTATPMGPHPLPSSPNGTAANIQLPDVQHLSTYTSPITSPGQRTPTEELDFAELCKVPSYHTAVLCEAGGSSLADCTPSYPNHSSCSTVGRAATAPGSMSHSTAPSIIGNGTAISNSNRSSSFSTMHQKHKSRNSSSIKNLVGMATSLSVSSGHGSSGPASPTRASPPRDEHFSFFSRTSSKTQISHLSDSLSGSAGNNTSTSLPVSSAGTPPRLSGASRNYSSRSLLDEATKLLHFHK